MRWETQSGMVVIPKAASQEHMKQNISIFDFDLTADEIQKIEDLTVTTTLHLPATTANEIWD